MNLEIHKPELVQRVNAHIQTGQFHDADEVLEKLLMPLTKGPLLRPQDTLQNLMTNEQVLI